MPGECLCYEGYTGENCTLAINSQTGTCTLKQGHTGIYVQLYYVKLHTNKYDFYSMWKSLSKSSLMVYSVIIFKCTF